MSDYGITVNNYKNLHEITSLITEKKKTFYNLTYNLKDYWKSTTADTSEKLT